MVNVPRAPKAGEAPEEIRRMKWLRSRLASGQHRVRQHDSFSFGPAICVFTGTGVLLLGLSLLLELAPQSPFAQLVVVLCARLPFGG